MQDRHPFFKTILLLKRLFCAGLRDIEAHMAKGAGGYHKITPFRCRFLKMLPNHIRRNRLFLKEDRKPTTLGPPLIGNRPCADGED